MNYDAATECWMMLITASLDSCSTFQLHYNHHPRLPLVVWYCNKDQVGVDACTKVS